MKKLFLKILKSYILNDFTSERKSFWTILKTEQKKDGEQYLFLNRFKKWIEKFHERKLFLNDFKSERI